MSFVASRPSIALIRALPPQACRIRLLSFGRDGERVIGDYTMNHGPHEPMAWSVLLIHSSTEA